MNVFYPLLRRLSSGTSQRASSSRTSRISAATQGNSGDGGGGDEDDEKMRQLKERNRMAAHRSREKKKVLKIFHLFSYIRLNMSPSPLTLGDELRDAPTDPCAEGLKREPLHGKLHLATGGF